MKYYLQIFLLTGLTYLSVQLHALTSIFDLPRDMHALILGEISKSETIDEAINALRALAVVNKEFNKIVNGPLITNYLITILANRFTEGDKFQAAILLRTKGTELYIQPIVDEIIKKIHALNLSIDEKKSLINSESLSEAKKSFVEINNKRKLIDREYYKVKYAINNIFQSFSNYKYLYWLATLGEAFVFMSKKFRAYEKELLDKEIISELDRVY